ncbi:hypothetical protein SCB49_08323 [unidentified eubacterium SCB49]|nr:hypothetical protein SCB49_08323 [unidentified eubacterium SCB49]
MNNNKLPEKGITIEDAIDWTAAWQSKYPNNSKAFLLPMEAIINLLKELNVLELDATRSGTYKLNTNNPLNPAIRAYLGIGPDENGVTTEKMVLVGAVEVGDEYQDQVEGTSNSLKVPLSGSGAFNFCYPCPVFCDKKSPLFH